MLRKRKTTGTTLIEVLVVMVVFLIGILAMLQIFPGGLKVLSETRSQSMATQLTRAESERLKARMDQLAEMILPVNYTFVGGNVINITVDMNRTPNNLGPNGTAMDASGNILSPGGTVGYWAYLTGANVMRRVVGEGGPVPAPRPVGNQFGGLMVLNFAPIVYNPAYPALFQVYGNDLNKREGAPQDPNVVRRNFIYYLENYDDNQATLWLPKDPNFNITYRLAMSVWMDTGSGLRQEDLIDVPIAVPAGAGYHQVGVAGLTSNPANFNSVLYDTVRVARSFKIHPPTGTFDEPGNPYECKLLDDEMGMILFDPEGHNYKEVRANGRRLPLVAKVSYDVFDWRILREEFRVPDTFPLQYRVAIGNHKIAGRPGPDGLTYNGLNVFVDDGSGGFENRDFLLVDLESGGIYTRNSTTVDKSLGLINFIDLDQGTPGLQSRVILPGQTTSVLVDSSNRSVRALYQANGEWAVQVMKAPAQYYTSYGLPLGVAQYFARNPWAPATGGPTRIYFPRIDLGKKVSIREVWYRDSNGNLQLIENQDFVIRSAANDNIGPFVDITEVASDAASFDYTRGYAIRGVKGASITIRALYNPSFFTLGANNQENLERFDRWGRTWKKITTDTYLQRGEIY